MNLAEKVRKLRTYIKRRIMNSKGTENMDSLTPSSEFWIAGVIFFGMAVFTCAAIVWLLAAVYSQTPSQSTVDVRLDEVELAVRNRERAGAELPSDRLLGTAAAANSDNAAVAIT
jgi:hypothetical protein